MEAAAHVLPEHQWHPCSTPTPAGTEATRATRVTQAVRAPGAQGPPAGPPAAATTAATTATTTATTTPAAPVARSLTDRDRRILEFERHWWRYAGAKEQAIRAEFALSATRYYQILNVLIDSPEALVAEPMLVRRLRRLRAHRRHARACRPEAQDRSGPAKDDDGTQG